MTGDRLHSIRVKLCGTTSKDAAKFGRALCYTGSDEFISINVYRLERAAKIPARISKLARIMEHFGRIMWEFEDEHAEQREAYMAKIRAQNAKASQSA